jgi:hypothetical protein
MLLLMAGCIGYAVNELKKAATEAMNRPLDVTAALAAMGDAPIYPGAQLDENMTKIQRGITATVLKRVTPADRMEVVAYSTVDPAEKVMAWYAQVMPKKGFTESVGADYSKFGRNTLHKQYRKGNDLVVVQPQQRTRETGDTIIVLMRFYNLREKGGS